MTTARVYHDENTPEQAIEEIRSGSGTRYDPMVVNAFLYALGKD
jgi:HD-GYP domain-containing protein (c-di-GMP phosphodiesterase class II)